MKCEIGCKCDIQQHIDEIYNRIFSALSYNADQFVPRVKGNFYMAWWNDALTDLKAASIAVHEFWKCLGRQSNGKTFWQMKRAKMSYKNAIKPIRCRRICIFTSAT